MSKISKVAEKYLNHRGQYCLRKSEEIRLKYKNERDLSLGNLRPQRVENRRNQIACHLMVDSIFKNTKHEI